MAAKYNVTVQQIVKQRQLTQSYLNQRVGKVPISVVRNLEHALKETEVSM